MGTLKGSNINPSLHSSPLDQMQVAKESTWLQRRELNKQLAKWRAFQKTESGSICAKLSDPMIDHCNHILSMSPMGTGNSLDVINDYKAEIRGQKHVWQLIKEDPEKLKRMLDELEDVEEEHEVGWANAETP